MKGGEAVDFSKIRIKLAACRVNADMNQVEFANALDVDRSTVANWEAGKTEPNANQLRKISELSGIPMDLIFVPIKS